MNRGPGTESLVGDQGARPPGGYQGRALILLMILCLIPLSACGKKGPPQPGGPADKITWPRAYPTQ